MVFGLHSLLDHFGSPLHPNAVLTQIRLTGWEVFWTDVVVVILGIAIGSAGSAIAIRRFLDV